MYVFVLLKYKNGEKKTTDITRNFYTKRWTGIQVERGGGIWVEVPSIVRYYAWEVRKQKRASKDHVQCKREKKKETGTGTIKKE